MVSVQLLLFATRSAIAQCPVERVPLSKPACPILNHAAPLGELEVQEPEQAAIQVMTGPMVWGHAFQYAVTLAPAATVAESLPKAPLALQARVERVGSWIGS